MSIMHFTSTLGGAGAAGGSPPGTVTLSGETTIGSDFVTPWYSTARFGIDVSSGNVYEYGGTSSSPTFPTSYTQVDSTNDWLRGGSDDGNFEVQVNTTSGSLNIFTINGISKTAGTTWYSLDGDMIIGVVNTATPPTSPVSATSTISIRYNGGATLDSASYAQTASNVV